MDSEEKITRLRELMREARPPAPKVPPTPVAPVGLTADDTLGRILRAMQPGALRYLHKFSLIGLVTLPIRYFTLIYAAGSWINTVPWTAAHDPWWFFKWLGGVVVVAFLWFIFAEYFSMLRAKRARKRPLKGR